MFTLATRDKRVPVLMQNGQPFVYTSRALAHTAKRILEKDREISLIVLTV